MSQYCYLTATAGSAPGRFVYWSAGATPPPGFCLGKPATLRGLTFLRLRAHLLSSGLWRDAQSLKVHKRSKRCFYRVIGGKCSAASLPLGLPHRWLIVCTESWPEIGTGCRAARALWRHDSRRLGALRHVSGTAASDLCGFGSLPGGAARYAGGGSRGQCGGSSRSAGLSLRWVRSRRRRWSR